MLTHIRERIEKLLTSICSLEEVRTSAVVRLMFGSILLSYFTTFSGWLYRNDMSTVLADSGEMLCWSYIPSCDTWAFLTPLPYGHSQSIFYMLLFACLIAATYALLRNKPVSLTLCVLPAYLWHTSVLFFLSGSMHGNFDYYLFLFGSVLLFARHKLFFIQLVLVLCYFLSSTIKIHEGWIVGTYFSSLMTGLPLVENWFIPVMTNTVIGMEMVGVWFLFSKNVYLRYGALSFFTAFHLYSGILVGYHYPTVVLPMLLIAFGPHTKPQTRSRLSTGFFGYSIVVCMCILQSISFIIPGDAKLTLEGNRFGFYMFEANHQCVSRAVKYAHDGTQYEVTSTSDLARNRCDPYDFFQVLKRSCLPEFERISWTFDHSVNGSPFYRIVDVENLCTLSYRPFWHNDWIRYDVESLRVVGYPRYNWYR